MRIADNTIQELVSETTIDNNIDRYKLLGSIKQIRNLLHKTEITVDGPFVDVKLFHTDARDEFRCRTFGKNESETYKNVLEGKGSCNDLKFYFWPLEKFLPESRIIFTNPTIKFLDTINGMICRRKLSHVISSLEIATDLYTLYPESLQEYIQKAVWLKNARNSWTYAGASSSTYYLNQRRQQSKALSVYIRPASRGGLKKVRVELQLDRNALRYRRLNSIKDLLDANLEQILSDISFCEIEMDRFEAYIYRRYRDTIEKHPASRIVYEGEMDYLRREYEKNGLSKCLHKLRGQGYCRLDGAYCTAERTSKLNLHGCDKLVRDPARWYHNLVQRFLNPNELDTMVKGRMHGKKIKDILR